MPRTSSIVKWVAVGAAAVYVAGKVAHDVMDDYREFQGAQELDVDYQARHAEELGRPFPGTVSAIRHRREYPFFMQNIQNL
ncbi:MAG: hypothetical protein J4400_01260 [Candidatus Aenigmarchaeota archaeon]|nr:hypothetical protein [Candidatus Aenigmarchaeota archaeon]